ncbi:hypothetical protein [Sphingomonas mesophila]|uniref:hypothetical protein n=1 Tax=Sphingomonas mesophila TaxID=2303576 RepID=UPI0013C2E52C|nr:hypothetical protein [Sphingomonas mesophila]
MRKAIVALFATSMAFAVVPASAQTNNGLVVVDLSGANVELLNNLARDLNLEINNNNIEALKNINVQVPIGLAAAICDVNANVLARQRKTEGSTCTARNNTAALTRAVREARAN